MKTIKNIFVLSIFSIILISCSKDKSNQENQEQTVLNYTSQLCNNVVGPKALYWDLSNGLSIPLSEVPVIENVGDQFIHSQLPYLGVQLPVGYHAVEIYDPSSQAIGVNVFRNDNKVVWRYIPTITFQGNTNSTAIIAFEINQIMDFYQTNVTPEVVCTETRTVPNGTIETHFTAKLINFGNFTATVWVQTMFFADINRTFTSLAVVSGPINEYDTLIMDVYLPLTWQLLVRPDGGEQDSDLDGYPDSVDPEPNNPSVP